jgi:hypothetical protein
MAITADHVSTPNELASGTTVVTTWSTNPTAGSKVLVFVQCGETPTSVVDNGATPSTFTLDVSHNTYKGAYVYRADNITLPASGSYHVTVTVPTGGDTTWVVGKSYLGMASGGPVISHTASGTSAAASSGSATPTDTGQLAFGGFSDMNGANPSTVTFTGSSPLAQIASETDGATYWPAAAADGILTSTTAVALAWTVTSSNWDAVVAIYAAATTGGTGGGTGPSWDASGSWTQIFSDDFNGASIDTTKWDQGWFGASGITPPVNSGSPQNNSANITVSASAATMKMATVGGTRYGSLLTTNPQNSASRIASGGGFQTGPPAAFEARINLPQNGTGVANWNAWWLDGQNWPDDGEIDILESLGAPDDNSYHVHDATNPDGIGGTHNLSPHPYDWHTFGCYWHDSQVDFYYDGAFVATEATDAFVGPLYLVLTSTYSGTPDVTPSQMLVDYVKVWTPGGGGGGGVQTPLMLL